jgi:hypothetical protein
MGNIDIAHQTICSPEPGHVIFAPADEKKCLFNQALSRVLSPTLVTQIWGMVIHLLDMLPCLFSNLTQSYRGGTRASSGEAPCIGLAPSGVYHAGAVTNPPVRSYRTLSPLPRKRGGLLSVALSFELPRLAVNQHHALWSSDFPPAR